MVELKTDYDQLSRVARMKTLGMHVVDLMTPLVGGLGGGPIRLQFFQYRHLYLLRQRYSR